MDDSRQPLNNYPDGYNDIFKYVCNCGRYCSSKGKEQAIAACGRCYQDPQLEFKFE